MRALAAFALALSCVVAFARCGEDGLLNLNERDAGTTPVGSGSGSHDAGTTTADAGPADAGPVDAGAGEDAGPPEVDAGQPEVDAGSPTPDGGSDGGPTGQPDPCGPPTIEPYVLGGSFGGFQSIAGSGYQTTITVTFPCPVRYVRATIHDPDFPGNVMIAYAGTTEVARASFVGDGTPGSYTKDTQTVEGVGITKLELVPDPLDYVAYDIVQYFTE